VAPVSRCPSCGGPGVGDLGELVAVPPVGVALTPPQVPVAPMRAAAEDPDEPRLAPVQPRPLAISFGIALIAFSLWLVFSWIPSKRPLTDAEAAVYVARAAVDGNISALREWRLKPTIYPWAYVIAILVGIWGVSGTVRGATHRPRRRRPPPRVR
jgi:hypothetical protein